jgi:hypothetical protein
LQLPLLLYKIPVVVNGMLQILLKNKDGSCEAGHHDKNTGNKAQEEVYCAEKKFHLISLKGYEDS